MENELKNEILKAIDFEIKTIEKATKAISFLKIIEPKFRIGENVLFPELKLKITIILSIGTKSI